MEQQKPWPPSCSIQRPKRYVARGGQVVSTTVVIGCSCHGLPRKFKRSKSMAKLSKKQIETILLNAKQEAMNKKPIDGVSSILDQLIALGTSNDPTLTTLKQEVLREIKRDIPDPAKFGKIMETMLSKKNFREAVVYLAHQDVGDKAYDRLMDVANNYFGSSIDKLTKFITLMNIAVVALTSLATTFKDQLVNLAQLIEKFFKGLMH